MNWTDQYDSAQQSAKTQHKLVLLDFTGSDWCGYCKLLDKEVLGQDAFAQYAGSKYVLVTIDFPRGKELPEMVKEQNDALQKKYNIDGFPTLIVLDEDGKELGRMVGYNPGSGPDAVIAQLKSYDKK